MHDPGFAHASARAERALGRTRPDVIGAPIVHPKSAAAAPHEIRVGTASWTDPTMVRGNVFYPRGVSSAEDRLRYYAEQFSVVEVDSTYYSLPDRTNAERWTERTPPHFSFHVKAHALMTGQPTEVTRLPEGLVEALPAATASKKKIYAKDLPPELLEAVWTYFIDSIAPLSETGKLGGVLLQYPRWFLPSPENKRELTDAAHVSYEALGAALDLVSKQSNGLVLPKWVPTPGNRTFHRTMKEVEGAVYRVIAAGRKGGAGEGTLLSMLLNSKDASTGEFLRANA